MVVKRSPVQGQTNFGVYSLGVCGLEPPTLGSDMRLPGTGGLQSGVYTTIAKAGRKTTRLGAYTRLWVHSLGVYTTNLELADHSSIEWDLSSSGGLQPGVYITHLGAGRPLNRLEV